MTMRDRTKMTPTALGFMAQVDEYRRRHKGVDEEEAIAQVRANGGVAVKPRRPTAAARSSRSTITLRSGPIDGQEHWPAPQPPPPLPPYCVHWADRDQRIAWGRVGHAIDMERLLTDIGAAIGGAKHFVTTAPDYEPLDFAPPREPKAAFRMTFTDYQVGLSFAPHGKRVLVWAHLFDLQSRYSPSNLGFAELTVDLKFDLMVRRIRTLLDKAEQAIDEAREKAAAKTAQEDAFLARCLDYARRYPEFAWLQDRKWLWDVSPALDYSSKRPLHSLKGKVRPDGIYIQELNVAMTDDTFAAFMRFLRRHKLLMEKSDD